MESTKNICRLCFDVIHNDFVSLDSHKIEMLVTISLNLDLSLTDNPQICSKCHETLQELFEFKKTCLCNEDYLKTFLQCDVKLNLEEIVKNSFENEIKCEEVRVCRFCLKYFDIVSFVKLNDTDKDIFLKTILEKCLPEIALGITDRPLICCNCMETVRKQFDFITICVSNDEKLKKRVLIAGKDGDSLLGLSNVLEGIDRAEIDCKLVDLNQIKVERAGESLNEVKCDVTVKKEELENIEDEEIHIKTEDNTCFDTEIESKPKRVKAKATKKKAQCTYCPFSSKSKYHVKYHIKVIHETANAEMFTCDDCGHKTYHKHNLKAHRRLHEEKTQFQCERCLKGFRQKFHLYGHILRSHEDLHHLIKCRIYSCEHCDYKTLHGNMLSSHTDRNHAQEPARRFYCHECSYSSLHKGNLSSHLYKHSQFRPHVCQCCQKGFTQKCALDSHILRRHGQDAELLKTITNKIHCCHVCPYRSIRMGNLRGHMKVHNKKTEKL